MNTSLSVNVTTHVPPRATGKRLRELAPANPIRERLSTRGRGGLLFGGAPSPRDDQLDAGALDLFALLLVHSVGDEYIEPVGRKELGQRNASELGAIAE